MKLSKQTKQELGKEFYTKFGSRLPCMTSGTRERIIEWFMVKMAKVETRAKQQGAKEERTKFKNYLEKLKKWKLPMGFGSASGPMTKSSIVQDLTELTNTK